MELDKFATELVKAVTKKLEVVNKLSRAHREQWFAKDDDGVYREVKDRYEVDGVVREFPRIGIEKPTSLELHSVTAKVNTDLTAQKNKKGLFRLFAHAFTGKDEVSELELEICFKQANPSGGILALHKRGEREIREACMEVTPATPDNVTDERTENNDG